MSDEIDLTSAEVKQAIADAVAEEVKGLKAKNAELIEVNKRLRKQTEIDPSELETVEAERDQLKKQLDEANKLAKKATAELEAANKRLADNEAAFNNSLRDSQLAEALAKAGVTNAVHLKAAKALLAGGLEVVEDGGKRVVMAGDKPLDEFITEWATGDEGSHFVTVPERTGGGATNGTGGRVSKTFGQMTGMERVELRRKNPTEHARLKAEHEAATRNRK